MCGIFAYVGPSVDAPKIAFEGIKLLEYRGYDSWGVGYIPLNSDKIILTRKVGKIGNAVLPRVSPSNIAFAHTRWATHGGVTFSNAHPHTDCTHKLAVIHNGIVENYKELKETLIIKGHSFNSETDSEIIAHQVEENLKTMTFEKAVFLTFTQIQGSNAICVMDSTTRQITACRNGSPLVVGIDTKKNQYFLGSDVPAFLKHTRKVYFLNDLEGVTISQTGISVWDIKKLQKKPFKITSLDWKLEDAEKSGFPHFLIKEIYDQKNTISKTTQINKAEILKVGKLIKKGFKPYLLGCGTASYCALAGKYFFAQEGISSESFGAYEFKPFLNSINKNSVIIAVSQSGETADTLIAIRAAKERGSTVVCIVNARGSTMERLSDVVINVGAGPEIAVVSTKAFTSQLANLYLIAKAASGNYETGIKDIKKLGKTVNTFINKDLEQKIIKIAKNLVDTDHGFVIGKHINYPAALEFALKTKESAYIHSEAFTAGELKHGVITLIEKGTPCFTIVAKDAVKDEVLSAAAELRARGGYIIGISSVHSAEFDDFIEVPHVGSLNIFVAVIAGQMLGYYLGVGRGNDPDKPRNLAKSVTVK